MTVAWNPGGATGSIPLVLAAPVANMAAACTVLAGDGTFTIPAYALLALPSSSAFLLFGPGDVRPIGSALFSASGLNPGIAQVAVQDILPFVMLQ